MCCTEFLNIRSLEKIFKFACALLTLLLISQELVNFAIVKPTLTSKEEKGLEFDDIPDVVICIEPGFDIEVLKKYGYKRTLLYYRGRRPSDSKFIGWNGDKKSPPLISLRRRSLLNRSISKMLSSSLGLFTQPIRSLMVCKLRSISGLLHGLTAVVSA